MAANQKYNAIGSAWLGALNWQESGTVLSQLPILIPVGGSAIEHGPYLPYDTDLLIASALVEAVAAVCPVLVAPPIDYVYAPDLAGVGLTMSLSADAFIRLVSDIVRSLARHGARHIVLVARGETTLAPLQIVSREMHEAFGLTIAIANEAGLAHDVRSSVLFSRTTSHADETETSLLLAIAPDRVRSGYASAPSLADASTADLREPVFIVPQQAGNRAIAASRATAEKGQQLFDATVEEIVAHLQSVTATWEPPTPLTLSATPHVAGHTVRPAETGVRLRNLVATDWDPAVADSTIAVLPMGAASKEHGYHLPNQTDYLTAEALGAAAVEHAPILLLPTFGYGYYPAFVDWPGSMSLSPSVYQRVIGDIINCLADAGIQRILLLDTGLSTRPVLEIVARDALRQRGVVVALATTELGRETAHELFDGEGTHANEDETALLLAIAPDQVDLSLAVPDLRPSTIISRRDPFAPPSFIQGGKMRSASGVFGDPTKATRENGLAYLAAKIDDLCTFLEAFGRS